MTEQGFKNIHFFIPTSAFLFELPNSKKVFLLLPAKNGKKIEVDLMMKCGSVGPCVVGLVGQVGAGHLTHPSPHLPHFVLLGFRKRCWFGKNGTIWMNKRCKEGENGVGFGWKNKSGKIGSEEYVGREMVQKLGRWPRLVLVNRSTWCIPASSNPNFHLLRANKQPWNTFSASSHLYFSLSLNIFVLGGPSINTLSHSFHCSLTLSSSLAMSLFPSDYLSINMLI